MANSNFNKQTTNSKKALSKGSKPNRKKLMGGGSASKRESMMHGFYNKDMGMSKKK